MTQQQKDILELITNLHDHYEKYHDQKDKMAYAIITLILAAGAAYIAGDFPPSRIAESRWFWIPWTVFMICFWAFGHYILSFQLKLKRIAAIQVDVFQYALRKVHLTENISEFKHEEAQAIVPKNSGICDRIKRCFWTMRLNPCVLDLDERLFLFGPKFLMDRTEIAIKKEAKFTEIEYAICLLSGLVLLAIGAKTCLQINSLPNLSHLIAR